MGAGRPGPHRAPHGCPVCGEALATTRLGCQACGTEIAGHFIGCRYCQASADDHALLEVFLASRGNMREVERFLGVSYPTARQRFAELLDRLGIGESTATTRTDTAGASGPTDVRADVLRRLAAGELDVEVAEQMIRSARRASQE